MKRKGFNASAYQVRIGWEYFYGSPLEDDMSFAQAGSEMVKDFGLYRVQAVLQGIPNYTGQTDEVSMASARTADESRK